VARRGDFAGFEFGHQPGLLPGWRPADYPAIRARNEALAKEVDAAVARDG
jgi:hypothetical protein